MVDPYQIYDLKDFVLFCFKIVLFSSFFACGFGVISKKLGGDEEFKCGLLCPPAAAHGFKSLAVAV